jgi:hypothetical protein
MQEFQMLKILETALRMKAQVDSSSRGWKDFICREERKKAAWGHAGTQKPVVPWVRLEIGFLKPFLYIAPGQRCLSGADSFLGRRSVSLANYHLWDLLQSILQYHL